MSTNFQILRETPFEILSLIFSSFCDGLSLSTLAIACHANIEEPRYHAIEIKLISQILKKRIEKMAQMVAASITGPSDSMIGGVTWIRATVIELSRRSKHEEISKLAAVLDFLYLSLSTHSDKKNGQFLWPVWCGRIRIDSYIEGSRLRNTAGVEILEPLQWPSFIPGCNLIHNDVPSGIFHMEPYNMVAIPPWGRIQGLQKEDEKVLDPVINRLKSTNFVGVPTGYSSDPLDVRILSSEQASRRPAHILPPRTNWLLDGNALVCCWHDDSEGIQQALDYVPYIIELMKKRRMILNF